MHPLLEGPRTQRWAGLRDVAAADSDVASDHHWLLAVLLCRVCRRHRNRGEVIGPALLILQIIDYSCRGAVVPGDNRDYVSILVEDGRHVSDRRRADHSPTHYA